MLISHKHKFITIDIPKTGTRSFRESLLSFGVIDIHGEPHLDSEFYQHDGAIRAKKQFAKNNWNWNEYFKFTIVRNPWQRYFSFFKYFKSYGEKYMCRDESINWREPEINQGKLCVELFKNKDNQTILKNIILNNNSQDSYYCDESGKIIVDHIAEFEDLQNEFVLLCDKVGIQAPTLQHGNKSANSLNIHDIYNQQLIDLVEKKEKGVIELKNYNYHV
jgi:chondroitin 4-sulfotransferase 11